MLLVDGCCQNRHESAATVHRNDRNGENVLGDEGQEHKLYFINEFS